MLPVLLVVLVSSIKIAKLLGAQTDLVEKKQRIVDFKIVGKRA